MNDFNTAATTADAFAGIVPAPAAFPTGSGSPIDRLPSPARAKFHAITAAAEDSRALTDAAWKRVEEAQRDLMHAEARLRGLDANNRTDKDAFGYKDAQAKVAAARETLDRLREQQEARVEAGRPTRELAFQLQRYAERQLAHIAEIEAAPLVTAPALKKGESFHDAVSATRARLERLRDDLAAVENATLPAEDAKRIAREQIAAIARRGAPNTLQLLEGRKSFSFAQRYIGAPFVTGPNGQLLGKAGADGYQPDTMATLCWLFERELTAAIEREIDAHADPASALTDEQIAKKTMQLRAAILECERIEESLIEQAEAAGLTIPRRPDADPRAILHLADDMPAPGRS